MNDAKSKILARLQSNPLQQTASHTAKPTEYGWTKTQKIQKLSDNMSAVRTEVHQLPQENWIDWLNQELPARGLHNVLVGENAVGNNIKEKADKALKVNVYDQDIESWKHELFHDINVGITTTRGAIAETGSLILWPDTSEPRLMSLVPPVHIALLDANTIYETFAEAIVKLQWAHNSPTNALLISGPSKTSDIEQTLAFGIHGPKQLIVLVTD